MAKKSTRKRREEKRIAQRKQSIRNLAIVLLILVGAAGYLSWRHQSVPEVAQARLVDNPVYGPSDAPVTIIEFGDFTCSACRSWHQAGVLFNIVEQYDGLVRLEWRDLPIITADSPKAAEAGQCAHDQGRFWDYLDRVYNEPGSSYTNARRENLPRYAADIGLDVDLFNACLDTDTHQATVSYDLSFAHGQGMNGTPSFMVNNTRIVGGSPELIIQAIEQELDKLQ